MNEHLRRFGFMVASAYIITIMSIWILAEIRGDTYFLAGEPVRVILYTEWVMGATSLYVLMREMFKNIPNTQKNTQKTS